MQFDTLQKRTPVRALAHEPVDLLERGRVALSRCSLDRQPEQGERLVVATELQ